MSNDAQETAERHWRDSDGDTVDVTTYDDGDVIVGVTADSDGVYRAGILSRAEALELYHFLGGHLMATGEFPANVTPLQAVPTCCTGEDSSTCCPGPATAANGWVGCLEPQPESVALEAHDAVYGDRQADYGHPREDFTRTAILWTGLLNHKLADGEFITPEDMARCMIAVKLSRDVHAPKRDNRVDMAGYAITLDRLETGR